MMMRISAVLAVASALASGRAAIADSPGDWLGARGKNAEWLKATAGCRDMLRRLDSPGALVRRYLPNVRRHAEMLRRTDVFDWKSITAVEFLENMLADLLAGVEPNRRYAGRQLGFAYWSETMQRIEAIWIHVPGGYDPAKRHQLFIYYKCGGGIHYRDGKAHGGYRPGAEVANRTDTFHAWSSLSIQVKGRMGVERELAEAPAALAREFSIDPDRVFLSGWSDGGFTAVWLASRWPHLVAGIAPLCANWQYSNVNDVGLCNVPMLCVDGWGDGGYNAGQFRRWHALKTMGCDVAGLWGHHGHSYKPYEDVAELGRIMAWAKTRRRDLWPRRVRYATWNLTWHRAYWLSIERMVEPWLAARIDARVGDDNRIEVRAWNVAAYRLRLSEKLVDPKRPLTVVTNAKPSYAGPFHKELLVEVVKLPRSRFVKSAGMPGGVAAQIERSTYQTKPAGGLRIPGRRWMWLRPTGGDERARKLLAGWAPEHAKDDSAVTEGDIAACNLFVFGGPHVNRFAARIAGSLPVKLGPGRFAVGRRVYDQPTNCLKLIHPNPLNPRKYVILYAFNDAAAFAANGFFGTKAESSWKFRLGDCVVMGIRTRRRRWGVARAAGAFESRHYVFDSNWRAPAGEPVGELTSSFSYAQLLRLRADAIREAAGADVGIVAEYTPPWSCWSFSLPAGAVTVYDLATVEMLPEYVTLGEVRGDELVRIVERAVASTVPAGGGTAPPQIDARKTYRVAMGCRGLPAYRAEPKKMPALHFFRTPEEFLAGGNTSLPVRNMRISPIETTQAVAQYIRKRGRVRPRRTCLDLTQYVMDPQANEFGAFDWLHLGADFRAGHPPSEGPRRYTLALGLHAAGDPAQGPPRENAKRFVELPPPGGDAVAADFARMGRKLPVTVAASVRRFAVVADRAGTSFRLAGPDTDDDAAQCVLVRVRMSNRGKRSVVALAVLSPAAMRRVEGGTWPDKSLRRPIAAWYAGYRETTGPAKRPSHQAAVLLLFDGPGARLGRLVAKGAGYNFGLVGIHRTVSIPAGGSASVPLLFIEPRRPQADLGAMLNDLKDEIARKLRLGGSTPAR